MQGPEYLSQSQASCSRSRTSKRERIKPLCATLVWSYRRSASSKGFGGVESLYFYFARHTGVIGNRGSKDRPSYQHTDNLQHAMAALKCVFIYSKHHTPAREESP